MLLLSIQCVVKETSRTNRLLIFYDRESKRFFLLFIITLDAYLQIALMVFFVTTFML